MTFEDLVDDYLESLEGELPGRDSNYHLAYARVLAAFQDAVEDGSHPPGVAGAVSAAAVAVTDDADVPIEEFIEAVQDRDDRDGRVDA